METLFIAAIIIFSLIIFYMNRKRNAWDILIVNSTLAIVAMFMVGILAGDAGVWKIVAGALGVVASGEKLLAYFFKDEIRKSLNPPQ